MLYIYIYLTGPGVLTVVGVLKVTIKVLVLRRLPESVFTEILYMSFTEVMTVSPL